MKNFIKNYKGTLILLLGMTIGTIVGLIFKEKASVLSPFGDIFINLLLVSIVPLIFLTITTSIGKMKTPKRVSKILITIFATFTVTSIISVLIGFASTRITLLNSNNSVKILESLDTSITTLDEDINFLERTAKTITTNDFINLLSKDNIIVLIVISILVWLAIRTTKESEAFLNVLDSRITYYKHL